MDDANFRSISILSNLSKVSERCLYNQLYHFFDKTLSIQQCRFQNGFSAQHCIIRLIEKWKQFLDQSLVFCIFLTDLSEAFDCLSYELLVAKLNGDGLETSAVNWKLHL